VDILYLRGMEKHCRDRQGAVKKWGADQGRQVMRRIDEMRDVNSLADLTKFPAIRFHDLIGNRKGQFSVDVKDPYRLVFEPANDPIPRDEAGGIALDQVTIVRLLEVVNTHDKKNKN